MNVHILALTGVLREHDVGLSAEMKKGVLEILWVVRARVFLGVCFRQHRVKAEQLSQCRPITVIATLTLTVNTGGRGGGSSYLTEKEVRKSRGGVGVSCRNQEVFALEAGAQIPTVRGALAVSYTHLTLPTTGDV